MTIAATLRRELNGALYERWVDYLRLTKHHRYGDMPRALLDEARRRADAGEWPPFTYRYLVSDRKYGDG